jgi:hypothetical protein
VALSLLVALGAGAGAGWLWRQHQATPPPVPAAESDTPAPEAPISLARREQFLKEAVEQYANPGKDRTQIQLGLGHILELGLFYLDQGRLEDADQLFARLSGPQEIQPYRYLGVLGHAIVLGLQSKPEQSNELFQQSLSTQVVAGLLRLNPRLQQWVASALDYNKINESPEHRFPEKLEPYRHPPPQSPRGNPEKPPGKKS